MLAQGDEDKITQFLDCLNDNKPADVECPIPEEAPDCKQ